MKVIFPFNAQTLQFPLVVKKLVCVYACVCMDSLWKVGLLICGKDEFLKFVCLKSLAKAGGAITKLGDYGAYL